ncbi:MAG: hypothetical protein V2A73_07925 [Pseudomonadota bacterium]
MTLYQVEQLMLHLDRIEGLLQRLVDEVSKPPPPQPDFDEMLTEMLAKAKASHLEIAEEIDERREREHQLKQMHGAPLS